MKKLYEFWGTFKMFPYFFSYIDKFAGILKVRNIRKRHSNVMI